MSGLLESFFDDNAPVASLVDSVAGAPDAFLDSGDLATVLVAATCAADATSATLLHHLRHRDADELLAAQLEDPLVREAILAAGLRFGLTLPGAAGQLIVAEVDALDPDDAADQTAARKALALLAVCPFEACLGLGLAPDCVAAALADVAGGDGLLMRYVDVVLTDSLKAAALPEPVNLHAFLAVSLLASPLGDGFLGHVARAGGCGQAAAAAIIAGYAAAATAAAMVDNRPTEDFEWERADAAIVRGCLEAAQISFEDISNDAWQATLPYRDEFDQGTTCDLFVGLTSSRVTFRCRLPLRPDPDTLLSRNYLSGLARFARDAEGLVVIACELPREGFAPPVLDAAIGDLRRALEAAVRLG